MSSQSLCTHGVLVLLTLVALASCVLAHPTKYPHATKEYLTSFTDAGERPPFFSYHIHILYMGNNKNQTTSAVRLYKDTINEFGISTPCDNLFHNPGTCYFENDTDPAGPFPVPQWAIYFLPSEYGKFTSWFMQNRGDFSVLIHGNSGDELHDHTVWALWGGAPWPLNTAIFE
eukprot:TRINITY_DN10677_c0_g1_i1.p2 TRINITY_DN10677_c0_g1~~TRINITY_DN10677_c0_g1_i1.p2  ORF type:complete len:185 (+),score=40.10 TRINITY_DN10677_c0_g1_i1:37-555(+)